MVREPDLAILQARANGSDGLHRESEFLGPTRQDLGGNLAERVRVLSAAPLRIGSKTT